MKDKVNTEKLNRWTSPSSEILKPKLNKGQTIMSEEEFDKIMNDE